MSRSLRIEYPGACYHVINRGNWRERIFFDDTDRVLFLSKLSDYAELYEIIIHSYCLMPNHFHLQIKTQHANLGKFMQSFITSFTLSMNLKHDKSGHLFQGRYKAQLIESKLYRNKLSRYIHLNPVKMKNFADLSLNERRKQLHDYRWSSFRSYIGIESKPNWLNRNHVLSSWGDTPNARILNYRKYVEKGLKTDNTEDLEPSEISNIIGSDSFKDRIVKKYLIRNVSDIDKREQPVLAEVNAFTVEDIIEQVAAYCNFADIRKITIRRGGDPAARKLAMFLVEKYCRRKETLSAMAKRFGVSISGLNMARDKFMICLDTDKLLQKKLKAIEIGLNATGESDEK
ncbi:MAG: transposase [Victivallaceae bacterium]|nr:transposase [Victivallaceae bacterium]